MTGIHKLKPFRLKAERRSGPQNYYWINTRTPEWLFLHKRNENKRHKTSEEIGDKIIMVYFATRPSVRNLLDYAKKHRDTEGGDCAIIAKPTDAANTINK